MATLELRPLGEALGTEALGVDLSKLDDATFAWIEQAFAEHPVLIFRNQRLGAGVRPGTYAGRACGCCSWRTPAPASTCRRPTCSRRRRGRKGGSWGSSTWPRRRSAGSRPDL